MKTALRDMQDIDKQPGGDFPPHQDETGENPDHGELIREVGEWLLHGRFDFVPLVQGNKPLPGDMVPETRTRKKPVSLVLAEETGVELGAPAHLSVSVFLWTNTPGLVQDRDYLSGDDIPGLRGKSASFGQVVMAELAPGKRLESGKTASRKNLTNRIPGVMTRASAGKLWVRIHKGLSDRGFSFFHLADEIRNAVMESSSDVLSVSTLFAVQTPPSDPLSPLFQELIRIHARARIINGENARLTLTKDGNFACTDFNCKVCPEKPNCDTIRELIVKKI